MPSEYQLVFRHSHLPAWAGTATALLVDDEVTNESNINAILSGNKSKAFIFIDIENSLWFMVYDNRFVCCYYLRLNDKENSSLYFKIISKDSSELEKSAYRKGYRERLCYKN